jgi:hypothetical protein
MMSHRRRVRREPALLTTLVLAAASAAFSAAPQPDEIVETQLAADRDARESQTRIDKVRDDTRESAARYAQALAEAESFDKYNAQLTVQLRSQEAEIASIDKQLNDIEVTNREVQPLMRQMTDTLYQFVTLDVPFLLEERLRRAQTLKDMIDRADVSISEKYRRILEAYQIELEYGRTLEAYEGRLGEGDDARAVQFVRLGRVSLMYRTHDGSESGYWDAEARRWVAAEKYAHGIEEASRIARRQGAPDLLSVPVPAPREIGS